MVAYAVKANGTLAVLKTFARLGAGADIVSRGEGERALAAGIAADKIIFSSVGKSAEEITWALHRGIGQINVESIPELQKLSDVATALSKTAPIVLRINPDIESGTHAKISTGHGETKFGIDHRHMAAAAQLAQSLPGVQLRGVASHIGSQITELEPFTQSFKFLAAAVRDLRALGCEVTTVDVGGGVGITYQQGPSFTIADYVTSCLDTLGNLGCKIVMEPGRRLVGDAGVLVTRVLFVKEGIAKNFLVVDAGMNDLVRPAMYDAWHDIVPVRQSTAAPVAYDVVGPVCETGDLFGTDRRLPPAKAGDVMAIMQAGAYGASMASAYNARDLIAEVMVDGDQFAVVRRAMTVRDFMRFETMPEWA